MNKWQWFLMQHKNIKSIVDISDFASLKHWKSLNNFCCAMLPLFALDPSYRIYIEWDLGFYAYFNFKILVNFCWIGDVKTPRMSTCSYTVYIYEGSKAKRVKVAQQKLLRLFQCLSFMPEVVLRQRRVPHFLSEVYS